MKTMNDWRDEIYAWAKAHGFHSPEQDKLINKMMLVNTELCEAVEKERNGIKTNAVPNFMLENFSFDQTVWKNEFEESIEVEVADAIIRLLDYAGMIGMDVDWWVKNKMIYNKSWPIKHNKEY